jgi:hypothetical protein
MRRIREHISKAAGGFGDGVGSKERGRSSLRLLVMGRHDEMVPMVMLTSTLRALPRYLTKWLNVWEGRQKTGC